MKLAIHPNGFGKNWIDFCQRNNIEYKIVDIYASDIINQVRSCDAFMWHHSHADYRDMLFAKQLIFSLETMGVKCFPDFHTTWHFDDKVGQKYLLEAVGAPLVPSYVFYTKKEAMNWIEKTSFPKVFKLRGGAGAANVKLAHNKREARQLVRKAFGRGFTQFDRAGYLKERYRKWREGKDSIVGVLKGIGRLFIATDFAKMHHREKGYAYFQDFIPNNDCDFRVKVVSGNCWAFRRKVRKNDFRASGSGDLIFDNSKIPIEIIKCAQKFASDLNLQSVAFDFVEDKDIQKFLIVEISYCFGFDDYETKNGYWDSNEVFHSEEFNPFDWMVENLIK